MKNNIRFFFTRLAVSHQVRVISLVKQLGFVFVGIMVLASCSQTALPTEVVSQEPSLPESVLETMDFATPKSDSATGIATYGSNIYVTGDTGGSLDGDHIGQGSNGFLRRYDMGGLKRWGIQFGGRKNTDPKQVAVDNSGNIYIAGRTDNAFGGFQIGGYDTFLIKYNPQGDILWGKQSGTKRGDDVLDIAINTRNEVYVLSRDDGSHYIIRRYNTLGKLLRTKDLALPSSVQPNAMTINSNNEVIVVTAFDNGTWKKDVKLYKYTRGLAFLSERPAYSSTSDDLPVDIATDSNDHIYITFNKRFFSSSQGGYLLKIHHSTNQELFMKRIGQPAPTSDIKVGKLAINSNDFVYVIGSTLGSLSGFTNSNPGTKDIIVEKYNRSGVRQWATQFGDDNYGSSSEDLASDIAIGDSVYITGYTNGNLLTGSSTSYGNWDAFVARLNIATGEIMGVDQ